MANCSFIALSVILVILSKIRVGGGWKIVRTFAADFKRNGYETDYYSNLYDALNDEHECCK